MTNIFKTENFLFDVENHDIRINGKQIKMVGTFEDPYFCGKDVAEALGYKGVQQTINERIDKEDKKILNDLEFCAQESVVHRNFHWPFNKLNAGKEGRSVYLSEQSGTKFSKRNLWVVTKETAKEFNKSIKY